MQPDVAGSRHCVGLVPRLTAKQTDGACNMGVRATVYSISADDYVRAEKGDASFQCDCELELDKSWHAIHFLLTGDTELRFLADGVEVVEGGDFSVTAHSPEAVVDLGERVEALRSALAQKM